jgi:nucleoside-diphosphate-sugar epimerase
MNIVVIGGGQTGKFGNDVVVKARQQGHRVLVLSHRNYGVSNPDSVVTSFIDIDKTVEDFETLISNVDTIDLLLYNSNNGGYPDSAKDFHSTSVINERRYLQGFRVHVMVPHALSLVAMKKMSKGSRIVFMTTDMIHSKERDKYLELLGYAGGKSYQHHLMLALAHNNDKDVVVSSISPHFDYNDKELYKSVFGKAFEYLMNPNTNLNAKVFDCWD